MTFLNKVAQFHAVNKMASHNLSTVFAPNLIKVFLDIAFILFYVFLTFDRFQSAESDMMAMVAHSPQVNALVVALVDHPQYFFAV